MEESGRHDEQKVLKKRRVLYYYNGAIESQYVPVYWFGNHFQIQSTHLSNTFSQFKYGLAWDKYAVMLIAGSDDFGQLMVMSDQLEECAFTFENYTEEKHAAYGKLLYKYMGKEIASYRAVVTVINSTIQIYQTWRKQQYGEWSSDAKPYSNGPLDPKWIKEHDEELERKAKYRSDR